MKLGFLSALACMEKYVFPEKHLNICCLWCNQHKGNCRLWYRFRATCLPCSDATRKRKQNVPFHWSRLRQRQRNLKKVFNIVLSQFGRICVIISYTSWKEQCLLIFFLFVNSKIYNITLRWFPYNYYIDNTIP